MFDIMTLDEETVALVRAPKTQTDKAIADIAADPTGYNALCVIRSLRALGDKAAEMLAKHDASHA